MTARAFLNVKMNCIALMGGQAHLTMMSTEMTQHHTCPLLDAAWQALERAKASHSAIAREGWLRLAEQWNTLARHAEEAASTRRH